MSTKRQQQRQIGSELAAAGYDILDDRPEGLVLRRDGIATRDAVPANIEQLFNRWHLLLKQREAWIGGCTPEDMRLIDARLLSAGYGALEAEDRDVLGRGGRPAEACLDDLQARLGVFTDDISADISGEPAALAYNGIPDALLNATMLMGYYAMVVRGEHPGWEGDRIVNGDFLLHQFARTHTEARTVMASIIERAEEFTTDPVGLSPERVQYAINRIAEALPSLVDAPDNTEEDDESCAPRP